MSFYAKNQMVWAKIQGYPWWPAIVVKSNQTKNGTIEDEVLVNFIGENSHAVVELDRIGDFEENFKQHSVTKTKKLADSIRIAQLILEGLSTYSEVRRKLETKTSRQILEELEAEKEERLAKAGKRKLSESKESPKKSNLAKKIQEKELKAAKEFENLFQLMLPTFTRASSKKDHFEMLTEPLIFNKRKNSKSSRKGSIQSLPDRHQKNDTKIMIESNKPNKKTDSPDQKNRGKRHTIVKTSTKSLVKEFKEKIKTLGKTPNSKLKKEEKHEKDIKPTRVTRLAKANNKNVGKGDHKDSDSDEALHESSEDNEDYGNVDVTIATSFEPEAKVGHKKRNKRLRIDSENDFVSPKYNNKTKKKDLANDEEETEQILKKIKSDNVEEEKVAIAEPSQQQEEPLSSNSEAKALIAYHNLKIKKIENDLEKILNKLSTKFPKAEGLAEDEEEFVSLVEIVKELESNKFSGAEYVNSDLGKLLKTIHFLFVKHKDLLPKTGNALLTVLAQTLHNIKNKIIQHCLDITCYVESLHIPQDTQEISQETQIFTAINVDGIRLKVEEPQPQPQPQPVSQFAVLHMEDHVPIAAKVEEDGMNISHKIPIKVFVPSPSETEDTLPPGAYFCKAEPEADGRASASTYYLKTEQVQKQETVGHVENFELRKKICQKFAVLLQKVYSMGRDRAQELTLLIEDKIYTCYANVNDYKQAIKGFLQLVKANKFNVNELVQFQNMTADNFIHILKQNFSTLSPSKSPERRNNGRSNTTVKREPTEEQTQQMFRRSPQKVKREASPTKYNMLTKIDNLYNINVKEEEPNGISSNMIKLPAQTSFQQKIEHA